MRRRAWLAVGGLALVVLLVALLTQVNFSKLLGTAGQQPLSPLPVPSGTANSPVMFIENVGQFDKATRFQSPGADRTIWLADNALWVTALDSSEALTGTLPHNGASLKLTFLNSNPSPRLEPFNRLDVHVSYLMSSDPANWHVDVPVWGGVRYVDIYPGVNLEVSGQGSQWNWQLVTTNAQAKLSDVRLHVDGADALAVETAAAPAGSAPLSRLSLSTSVGNLTLPLLTTNAGGTPAITNGHDVVSPFVAPQTQSVQVQTSSSPATAGVTSTSLIYSTFLGGSNADDVEDIAVDAAGNAYVTGGTTSLNFPATLGAFTTTQNGSSNVFVAKLNPAGSALVYATYFGGNNNDRGNGIAVDGAGDAYVTGIVNSPDFPVTPGALDTTCGTDGKCNPDGTGAPASDAFVAKLNPTGTGLLYSTFLGGSGSDEGLTIALDGSGDVHIAGDTRSADLPVTGGAADASYNGALDAFVAGLNSTGSALSYATFFGGSSDDSARDLALDKLGNAYITGYTDSADLPLKDALTITHSSRDAFVAKLSADGHSLVYSTLLGGSGADYGLAIAVDGNGNAYVMGNTFSPDLPTTPGAFDKTYKYDDDFVAKLSASGSKLVYCTYLGGNESEFGFGDIVVDGAGNAYVAGMTRSPDFPTTSGALDASFSGASDAFVARLNRNASALAYVTFLGGSARDRGVALAVAGSGQVYAVGYTNSSDFPTTSGAFDTAFNGSSTYEDTFVTKLTAPTLNFAIAGQVLDDGKPISNATVSDSVGHTVTTDDGGYYALGDLTAGVYTVTLTKSGDATPVAVRVISVPPDAGDQNFVLFSSPKNVFLPIVMNNP